MEILLTCLLFALGILLVVKGGDWFVDAASWIAKALNIPTFIIGATIVSLATTMPEMIVSVIASAEGKTDMAIGNAVGSVTANTALIMAVAMVAMSIVCSRKKYLPQICLLIAASGMIWVSSLSGSLSIVGSIILALIFVVFMTLNVLSARAETASLEEKPEKPSKKELWKHIGLFLVGAAAIVGGSRLMVNSGSDIAAWLHIPERIVAVTLIAIATSLPELVTTITAIIKKESALSIGNIIGANIIDLSLILPICSLVSGQRLPVTGQLLSIDLPACFIVTLIAMIPLIFRQKASKLQGIVLLAAYAAYLVLTI